MMDRSTPYELTGRAAQKGRTRAALLAAARDLLSDGDAPTVEAAAERAGVSRTAAYRYFPNRLALLAAAHPETVATSLLPADAPDDAVARLDLVVDAFTRMIVDTEAQQRSMLRLSLDADVTVRSTLPLRQGRAIVWIEEALEAPGIRLTPAERHRLALAVRSAIGIESLVWLTDVGGLARDDARELMRASARALLTAALASSSSPDPTAAHTQG